MKEEFWKLSNGIGRICKTMINKIKDRLRNIAGKNESTQNLYESLSNLKTFCLSKVPDGLFAKLYCKENMGKWISLKSPQTYDEKLWWLKLNYKDPLMTTCSDKYLVRNYVKACGLEELLIPLEGIYANFDEINFQGFKKEVILKCTHVSGGNLIYNPDEIQFDIDKEKRRFNRLLKKNYFYVSREWNYKNINPKIVIEDVIRDCQGMLPKDYKFLCFYGKPKLMYLMENTCTNAGKHEIAENRFLNVYDMDWNLTNISQGFPIKDNKMVVKPQTFELMKNYAAILSTPFPECRVDFYECDGKVYFGELTFYDGGGCNNTQPHEWDLQIGEWIDLERAKKSIENNYA